jgi:hypothetical protein
MSCSRHEATKLIADLWAALEDAGVAETGALAANDPKLNKDADADRGRAMIRAWLTPQTGGIQ